MWLKTLHVTCAVLTLSGFTLRAVWMLRASPMLTRPWVRVLPHIIDTTLLVSAMLLAWQLQQYPLAQAWLTAKVIGLLLYIVLGSIALKRGKTRGIRMAAWLAATAVFLYIVAVAVTHTPWPPQAWPGGAG
jgi:uncharacterized membrane protein SirB2